jgi:hypothetical protein
LISTVLCDILSLKMMYKYLKKVIYVQENFFLKTNFFVGILKVSDENRRIRIH